MESSKENDESEFPISIHALTLGCIIRSLSKNITCDPWLVYTPMFSTSIIPDLLALGQFKLDLGTLYIRQTCSKHTSKSIFNNVYIIDMTSTFNWKMFSDPSSYMLAVTKPTICTLISII